MEPSTPRCLLPFGVRIYRVDNCAASQGPGRFRFEGIIIHVFVVDKGSWEMPKMPLHGIQRPSDARTRPRHDLLITQPETARFCIGSATRHDGGLVSQSLPFLPLPSWVEVSVLGIQIWIYGARVTCLLQHVCHFITFLHPGDLGRTPDLD